MSQTDDVFGALGEELGTERQEPAENPLHIFEIEEMRQRQSFIRSAAIALFMAVPAEGQEHLTAKDSWLLARNLWESKPEDC